MARPGEGPDRIAPGAGADQLVGALAELDGDVVADFEREEAIFVFGATFGAEALTVAPGSSTLSLDADGDGDAEAVITLEGAFEDAAFMVAQEGGDVRTATGAGGRPSRSTTRPA